jgi:hypothetical protein
MPTESLGRLLLYIGVITVLIGEFHTFVVDGPIFQHRVKTSAGEKVLRDGYWFLDML